MKLQECLTEASRECWSRFCDTTLCTSRLSSETREEVVLSLLWSQDWYWRKNTECISWKEDYLLSSWTLWLRTLDVLNVIDWVRNTSVLCYALISEVNLTISINCYVLKESVTCDCAVDVWLWFLVKIDNLCIATTFQVEDTLIIPSVLVITNELTLWLGRKSCLTCTRKTEEDSGILTLHIGVCRAVHSCHTLQWQEVVHHWEHTLLHFTTVPSIDNYLLLRCYVEHNTSLWVQAKLFPVLNLCLWSIVNNEIWLLLEVCLWLWTDEHICYKVSLPSNLNDETNCHSCIFVSTTECINYEKTLVRKLFLCKLLNYIPSFLWSRVVIILILRCCPPYCILRILIHNDEFILRRTTCVNTCHYVNSAKLCYLSLFITSECLLGLFFEELLIRRVVNDLCCSCNAILC